MSYIECNDLTKIIKKQEVLSHVQLSLEQGRVYGFCGRNGSGKTMLFRAIAGLIAPTSGSVTVDGRRLGRDCEFPPDMGLVIENTALWGELSGLENLKRLAGIRGKIGEAEMREAMQAVGLNPDERKKTHKYSLGMKQKLAIAQAIMERPALLIFDEPTNSLDEASVTAFRALVRREQARGATVLIASHIKADLEEVCHTIFRMADGRLVGEEAGQCA